MKHSIKLALSLGVSVLLTACSTNYAFNSNLDSTAIKEYFKASDVQVYQDGVSPNAAYKIIGLVEGESCQALANDAPASQGEARTQARKKAADLQANGIIIKKCALIPSDNSAVKSAQGCYSKVICVGQAIKTASSN